MNVSQLIAWSVGIAGLLVGGISLGMNKSKSVIKTVEVPAACPDCDCPRCPEPLNSDWLREVELTCRRMKNEAPACAVADEHWDEDCTFHYAFQVQKAHAYLVGFQMGYDIARLPDKAWRMKQVEQAKRLTGGLFGGSAMNDMPECVNELWLVEPEFDLWHADLAEGLTERDFVGWRDNTSKP